MSHGVLIIEDETTLAKNIRTSLSRHHYDARIAASAQEGMALFATFRPDIVLLDLHLPDAHGLEVLSRLRQQDTQVKVIVITGHESVQTAVEAMKTGAYDYLSKPLVLGELKILLDKAVEHTRLEGALSYYHTKEAEESSLEHILGNSPPIRALKEQVRHLLQAERTLTDTDLPAVLITGETGTGKELVARALHYNGCRRAQPLVEISCAAIPAHLLEAELFGYEQGAFTDAKGQKRGLFEAADGGTLLLDEIGDLDFALQAKLLKTLEDKVIRRVGGLRDRKVDIRIIAATNQNLEQAIRQGTFRADLYFRLRVIPLTVPPLRVRGDDILLLAQHFVALHCQRYGKSPRRFSPAAEQALLRYPWPGNVRELRHVMEQTVLLSPREVIEPTQLPLLTELGQTPYDSEADRFVLPPQGMRLEEVERDIVQQALAHASWNVTQAAKLLGLSRDTLRYRIEKYKLKKASRF